MKDKVDDMRSWALSRIRQCRADEEKMPHNIDASAERRALESVLEKLGCSCPHSYKGDPVNLVAHGRPLVRCVICLRPAPADKQPHLWPGSELR